MLQWRSVVSNSGFRWLVLTHLLRKAWLGDRQRHLDPGPAEVEEKTVVSSGKPKSGRNSKIDVPDNYPHP